MRVNERIVEQYEYRMGDYTESSCAVLNHGMEWKLGAQGTCSRSQSIQHTNFKVLVLTVLSPCSTENAFLKISLKGNFFMQPVSLTSLSDWDMHI